MFTIDAFGRRVRCMPRLRFVEPPEGESGGGGGDNGDEGRGFPANTPLDQMTAEQREAYWKHQSKEQQRRRETAERERDALKPKAEKYDKTDLERAVEAAREEARREGEVIGAEKYLREAVKGRFQALTGKPDEEVETAFAHVDANTFVGDDGELDTEAIKKFAETFGPKAAAPADPVRDRLGRQRPAGGAESGMSMSERREAARERTSRKKTTNT